MSRARARPRLGILSTHPIQYQVPWFRALAQVVDLQVFFSHQATSADQASSEFGVAFEWDVPLLDGYSSTFLINRARKPDLASFAGCDTPELAGLVRHGRFDAFLVNGWYTRSYWQAMRACWQSGTPLLVRGDSQLLTQRSQLKRLLKAVAYRGFIPHFAAYLVVGQRARSYYLHYGAAQSRMFFAPHSVDNAYFNVAAHALRAQRAAIRAQWGLPEQAVVCLFAGKLVARKRPADVIQALADAGRTRPQLWGLVVGAGPQRAELEALARQLGARVRFVGFLNQSAMPSAYAVADSLVLPSDASETWGLVVNEAMAAGIPAIVSDQVGCAPDLVLSGQTGDQFTMGDQRQLAAQLAALTDNPARRVAMGRAAARHIQRYALHATVAGTLAAISAVGASHRLPGR